MSEGSTIRIPEDLVHKVNRNQGLKLLEYVIEVPVKYNKNNGNSQNGVMKSYLEKVVLTLLGRCDFAYDYEKEYNLQTLDLIINFDNYTQLCEISKRPLKLGRAGIDMMKEKSKRINSNDNYVEVSYLFRTGKEATLSEEELSVINELKNFYDSFISINKSNKMVYLIASSVNILNQPKQSSKGLLGRLMNHFYENVEIMQF